MKKAFTIIIVSLIYTMNMYSHNWQTYPYSPAGTVLSFPVDDGRHTASNTNTEWWYINLHLIGSAPNYKVYDVMLCYFNKPANMRIFNIAVPATGTFHTNVNRTQLALTSQTGHWELSYYILLPSIRDTSKWTYPTDSVPYRYYFHAENPTDNDGLKVTVTNNRPPINIGGDCYIPIGTNGDSSFYYSYSNMKVEGTIKFAGVTDTITSGIGWIDRQWGPFTVGINTNNLYEWFSMQLDKKGTIWGSPQTPSEFNIWQTYTADSNNVPCTPASRLISGIYPDNSQDTSSGFIFERTSYWHDQANNKYYSSSWRLINPLRNITLDMFPTITNQVIDVTLFKFWEGAATVKGLVENKPVDGIGFAELVKSHTYMINTPSAPASVSITPYADHNTISWSASTAGTFPIGGYRVFRSTSTDGYWKYLATTTALLYDDYTASPDTMFYYTVTSFDNQSAVSASAYASPVFTGIKDISSENSVVNIYPNPAKDQINIDVPTYKPDHIFTMDLLNIDGRILKSQIINKYKTLFDISALPLGIYVCRVTSNNSVTVKKIVKE